MGQKLAHGIGAKGYEFAYTPVSNMIFPVMTREKAAELAQNVMFEKWLDNADGTQTIRFVTSWATTEDDIDGLLALL